MSGGAAALRVLGLVALYLLPLALLGWGFRMRRRWREQRGLEPVKAAAIARAVRQPAPTRTGFHIEARQVALVYAGYVVLLAVAVVSRRTQLALVSHVLYFGLLVITWWSALSPRQFASEQARDPHLTRSEYVKTLIGFFGVMPLAVWLILGLPALRTTMDVMRGAR